MSGKNKNKTNPDDPNSVPPVDDANLTDAEKAEKDRREAEERDTQRGFGQPPTPVN